MACLHCPTCGRAMPKAKPHLIALVPLAESERAHLSDRQIHEHYKATAHVEDVRFAIKHNIINEMPEYLRLEWALLLDDAESGRIKRAETHRRLWRLCAQWGRLQLAKTEGLFGPPKPGLMRGATKITVDWERLHRCKYSTAA